MIVVYIIIAIIVVIILYGIYAYNHLIAERNRVEEAWADIDVQLKRRHDLIPNLVDTVKGYAKHEQETFNQVTNARTEAIEAGNTGDKQQAENALGGALKSLFAVAEDYPDLKASDNFQELQRELSDTENKIQAARRFYNTNVRDLNTDIEQFPSNVIANSAGIGHKDLFEIEQDSDVRENVDVQF